MIVISSKELETINESFIKMSKHSKNLFENFYSNFFSKDPSIKELFHNVDLQKQKKMLFESISYFLTTDEITADDIENYANDLKTLHQSLQISNEQINSFKEAFLMTLKETLGIDYTKDVENIWTKLITNILTAFSKKRII